MSNLPRETKKNKKILKKWELFKSWGVGYTCISQVYPAETDRADQ